MGITGFQRQRRLRAAMVTPPTPTNGLQQTQETPQTQAPEITPSGTPDTTPELPPALRLINGVSVVREIQAIPTVGAKAAAAILKARPEGGYPSLDAVASAVPHIFEPPFTASLEAIAAWGAE